MKEYFLILILLCIIQYINASTVLGIDFGSDTFKMALIKGNTFEVIINKESSRKTLNAVGFTKSMERVYGNRASSLVTFFLMDDSIKIIKIIRWSNSKKEALNLLQNFLANSMEIQ